MKKRFHILEECSSFVRFLTSSIGYCDESLSVIVRRAVESGDFSNLTFLKAVDEADLSEGFSYVWSKSVDSCVVLLDLRSRELLKSLGSRLGKTDTSDQLELCEYYKQQFEELETQARKNINEQVKLCRLTGSAVGVLLFVLFSGG